MGGSRTVFTLNSILRSQVKKIMTPFLNRNQELFTANSIISRYHGFIWDSVITYITNFKMHYQRFNRKILDNLFLIYLIEILGF